MKSVQDNKDIKLSDKQKEVIRLMREGKAPCISTNFMCTAAYDNVPFLSPKAIYKLLSNNIVQDAGTDEEEVFNFYTLTELGKTIQL